MKAGAMDYPRSSQDWAPAIRRDGDKGGGRKGGHPLYLAIADAIAADIQAGALVPGDRLPPHRTLAEALDIDFTTVSRAYAEARKRGLIEGRVGQGTYIRAGRTSRDRRAETRQVMDMAMNLPPKFEDPALSRRLWAGIAGAGAEGDLDFILQSREAGGDCEDKAAGARWLAGRLPGLPLERLVVCPGAQGALLSLLTLFGRAGEPIAVEALAYPGFRSLAAHLAIPLLPVAMDHDGLIPDSFEEICRKSAPTLLYCTPTLHNPTTVTMPRARREAIAEVARRYGVQIIEDDAYGIVSGDETPPIAAFAPDIVHHVAGLSKCLSPSLRIAYVAVPDTRAATRLVSATRATASMASPLGAAIATRWIGSGLAEAVLAGIRAETEARRQIAVDLLGAAGLRTARNAFHAWLPLTNGWTRGEMAARLRLAGIGVVTSDVFAVGEAPEAVRIGLGAAPTRERLRHGLEVIADLATSPPAMSSMVI